MVKVTVKVTVRVTVKVTLDVTVRVMRKIICNDASNAYKILQRSLSRVTINCHGPCNALLFS